MTKEESLRMALDFIERTSSYLPTSFDSDGMKIHAMLKEALSSPNGEAQPAVTESHKQEPVAFVKGWNCGRLEVIVRSLNQRFKIDQPLYTSPQPNKTWVEITPEELIEASNQQVMPKAFAAGAAWANAKLKEKNT